MFIVIDENYKVYQTNVLSGALRSAVRKGKLSLVEIRKDVVRGMNRSSWQEECGEYSEVQQWRKEFLDAS